MALYRRADAPDLLDFANALRPAAILKEHQGDTVAARQLWADAHSLYGVAGIQAGVEESARRLRMLTA